MWICDNVGLYSYVYGQSFISFLVFSLYFYLDDSSLVGRDIVGQRIFYHIQTFHFSYQCHKSHFTSYKPANGVIFIELFVVYNFF